MLSKCTYNMLLSRIEFLSRVFFCLLHWLIHWIQALMSFFCVFQIRQNDSWHRWAWPVPADRGLLSDVIVWMTAVSQMKWVSTQASALTVTWSWRCLTSLLHLSLSQILCVYLCVTRRTHRPSHTSANRTHPLLKPSSLTRQRVILRRLGTPFLSGIEPRDRTVCLSYYFTYCLHIHVQ